MQDVKIYIALNSLIVIFSIVILYSCIKDEQWKEKEQYEQFIYWLILGIINIAIDSLVVASISYSYSDIFKRILFAAQILTEELMFLPFLSWVFCLIEDNGVIVNRKIKLFSHRSVELVTIILTVWILLYRDDISILIYYEELDLIWIFYDVINTIILLGYTFVLLIYRKEIGREMVSFLFIVYTFSRIVMAICPRYLIPYQNFSTLFAFFMAYTRVWQKRKETLLVQEREIAKMNEEMLNSEVSIMISQIQPHFLYNTLASISRLCKVDPLLAQKTTNDFANYLRGNMDSINSKDLIPFEKELEHTTIYLNIEKIRFRERLNVVYDVNTKSFFVPALALQTIVENAVKHGVCKKEEGGTVTIKTYEDDDNWYIQVIDDGVGFKYDEISQLEGNHVGIRNTKLRLEKQCGGVLNIESSINVGTTATIMIPKEKR